jgi:hypothetical protein
MSDSKTFYDFIYFSFESDPKFAKTVLCHLQSRDCVYNHWRNLPDPHNNLIDLDPNIIYTSQGIETPLTVQTQNRVGDVIHSHGITLQFCLEFGPHQIECTFRIYVVKSVKGDRPSDGKGITKLPQLVMIF